MQVDEDPSQNEHDREEGDGVIDDSVVMVVVLGRSVKRRRRGQGRGVVGRNVRVYLLPVLRYVILVDKVFHRAALIVLGVQGDILERFRIEEN